MIEERAHARRSDPGTSHEAAAAVTRWGLLPLQRIVEAYASRFGDGFYDVDLCEAHPDIGESTLRTRRAELVARNILLPHGKGKPAGSTTNHTKWIHRNFATGLVPDVVEPPAPAAPEVEPDLRSDALTMAAKLDAYSTTQRNEGRVYLSNELAEAARIMRGLCR